VESSNLELFSIRTQVLIVRGGGRSDVDCRWFHHLLAYSPLSHVELCEFGNPHMI
jgi:hypothetical protein